MTDGKKKCGMVIPGGTREHIDAALRSLHAKGIIRDTGRRRGGQILWEITEAGKAKFVGDETS